MQVALQQALPSHHASSTPLLIASAENPPGACVAAANTCERSASRSVAAYGSAERHASSNRIRPAPMTAGNWMTGTSQSRPSLSARNSAGQSSRVLGVRACQSTKNMCNLSCVVLRVPRGGLLGEPLPAAHARVCLRGCNGWRELFLLAKNAVPTLLHFKQWTSKMSNVRGRVTWHSACLLQGRGMCKKGAS